MYELLGIECEIFDQSMSMGWLKVRKYSTMCARLCGTMCARKRGTMCVNK